jgi:VWFA-related protein
VSGPSRLISRLRVVFQARARALSPVSLALVPPIIILLAALTHGPKAQNADTPPRFRASTAAVQLDVVVRDRSGNHVATLDKDDFSVTEDNVPQRIIFFARVDADSPRPNEPPLSEQPTDPGVASEFSSPRQSVVALVFHQLSHGPRASAARAATVMLDELPSDEYVGIFVVDVTMKQVVPFTRNTAALKEGLRRALMRPAVQSGDSSLAESAGSPAQGRLGPGATEAEAVRQRMEQGLRQMFKSQRAIVDSLSFDEITRQLARFPGRKTVVLFSEGLAVTPRLEGVVDRAWAQNVTFYAIDATGLSAGGRHSVPVRELSGDELTSSSIGSSESRGAHAFLERDPTLGLRPLAEVTGGTYVADTNDLSRALRQVNADRRSTYYMVGYSSSNPALDNTERHIEVRVRRPGLSVRARTGYVAALPDSEIRPDYEQPVLAALREEPPPHAFPFRVRVFNTPMPGRPGLASVLVEVSNSVLDFVPDLITKKYAGQMAILTRILSGSRVLASQSELIRMTGDLTRLDSLRKRNVLYFRAADLPPGVHQLEAAVHDGISQRSSVERYTVEVPPVTVPLIGDLLILDHVEPAKLSREKTAVNPLAWRKLLLFPSFGEPFARGTKTIKWAVSMVLAKMVKPSAMLVLLAGDRAIARVPLFLVNAQDDGRLVTIGEFPIGTLPSGRYALQLRVDVGERSQIRSAVFVISE